MISIDDLVRYRHRTEILVERVAETRLPTRHGDFTAYGYHSTIDDSEHIALVYGDLGAGGRAESGPEPVLTRVHSECLTGDVFGSQRCDCGPQLDEALEQVVAAGRGVVVYLRGHEGRGIGLVAKLQAYALQDAGRDTVDANLDLGLPADARHYGAASQVLRDLGVSQRAAADQQPREVREPRGLRDPRRRAGAAHAAAQQAQPGLPAHQARPDGPQPARAAQPARPADTSRCRGAR